MAVHIIRDGAAAQQAIDFLMTQTILAYDSETQLNPGAPICCYNVKVKGAKRTPAPFDPHTGTLRLMQFGTEGGDQYVFDCNHIPVERLRPLFESGIELVFHNAVFDMKFLKKYSIYPVRIFDTMLAAQIFECGFPAGDYDLRDVLGRVLGIEVDKTEQASDWSGELTDAQWAYAAADVEHLIPLRNVLAELCEADGLARTVALDMAVVPVVVKMEYDGVVVDTGMTDEILAELSDQMAGYERTIRQITGSTNPTLLGSPKQIVDAFAKFGIVPTHPTKKRGGQPLVCTESDVLERIDHPLADALVEYRRISKLVSTYLLKFPELVHPVTGRMHTQFTISMTVTGRLSSARPNLHNIPARSNVGKAIRSCFTAPPGQMIVVSDYEAIELRLMAIISKDPKMCIPFKSGEDLHSATTRDLFPQLAHLDKGDQEFDDARVIGKECNFSIGFGVSIPNLFHKHRKLLKNVTNTKRIVEGWKANYPGVMAMFVASQKQAMTISPYETRTLMGRRRLYDMSKEPWSIRNQAGNHPIQGTAANIMKAALVECYRAGLDIVLTVHDEIILYSTPGEAESNARKLEECMRIGADKVLAYGGDDIEPDMTIPAAAKVALSWGAAKN